MATYDAAFSEELERRMAILEDDGYEDPARNDLPVGDIVALVVIVVLGVLVSYAVLY